MTQACVTLGDRKKKAARKGRLEFGGLEICACPLGGRGRPNSGQVAGETWAARLPMVRGSTTGRAEITSLDGLWTARANPVTTEAPARNAVAMARMMVLRMSFCPEQRGSECAPYNQCIGRLGFPRCDPHHINALFAISFSAVVIWSCWRRAAAGPACS